MIIMRRLFVLLFLTLFMFDSSLSNVAASSEAVSARNAILMEQDTGRILFEKSAHEKRRIASITKIMTAILAVESGKLSEDVTVSEFATTTEGSSLYLKENEKIKLEHLVYGLMLRSGNDAAVAIAEHVGGSLEGFVFLMNQKAEEIGMRNSHFTNPHGLDDSDSHYSTAYDMAILTKYAMENDIYRKISSTKVYRAPNPTEKWERVWKNKNRLLTELYEHSTGGKTGYTKKAKRTLVSTAEKDAMKLIAVTLNGPDDWNDHIAMFERAYNQYHMVQVVDSGFIAHIEDKFYRKRIYLKHEYNYPVLATEKNEFTVKIVLAKPKKEWKEEGNVPNVVGTALILYKDIKLKELPIYYDHNSKQKPSFFEKMKEILTSMTAVKMNG